MHPEKQFFTSGKYEGSQKWTLIWDEKQYALWQDMMNAEKFNFVFDNCWGISDEMNGICEKILFDPIFSGESWMQLSAEYSPVIDSMIYIRQTDVPNLVVYPKQGIREIYTVFQASEVHCFAGWYR